MAGYRLRRSAQDVGLRAVGPARIKYVDDILYDYNVNYGDNDNSNKQKLDHRAHVTYDIILKRKPLRQI